MPLNTTLLDIELQHVGYKFVRYDDRYMAQYHIETAPDLSPGTGQTLYLSVISTSATDISVYALVELGKITDLQQTLEALAVFNGMMYTGRAYAARSVSDIPSLNDPTPLSELRCVVYNEVREVRQLVPTGAAAINACKAAKQTWDALLRIIKKRREYDKESEA